MDGVKEAEASDDAKQAKAKKKADTEESNIKVGYGR